MNNVKRFISEINKVYGTNLTKTRVGWCGDGGYITLEELNRKTTILYTAGIGDDIAFELDFKHNYPDTRFKLFDPTIECLPIVEPVDKFIFSKSNLIIGEMEGNNNLLKMDIEYDEWETLMNFDEDIYKKFSQMIIEFHLVNISNSSEKSPYFTQVYNKAYDRMNDILFGYYSNILEGLNSLFYIYHISPNNSLPKINIGGFSFPPLLEVSFVRKDLVEAKEAKLMYPMRNLDYPNKIDRPDIENFYPIGRLC